MTTKIVESLGDNAELDMSEKLMVAKIDSEMLALEQRQEEFAAYLQELKEREEKIKELKDKLYEKMTENGIKKLENDRLMITIRSSYKRHSIDTAKMKAMNPALFEEIDRTYGKDTDVKGCAIITVKEKK